MTPSSQPCESARPALHPGLSNSSAGSLGGNHESSLSCTPSTFSIASVCPCHYNSTVDDISEQWTERARYDLDTAEAMFKAGRYLYVLFCCQQAVEKALKAVIVKRTRTLPPRSHNLPHLAEIASIESDSERVRFMGELTGYYIQSRYPEEIRAAASTITQELARTVLGKAEKEIKWVLSILQ
jgi:HEPN domain-containing protein